MSDKTDRTHWYKELKKNKERERVKMGLGEAGWTKVYTA